MAEIRNSIGAGLIFGLLAGIFLAILININFALIVGSVSGFAFGATLYFFVTSKIVKRQTRLQIENEQIIYSGGANHFINGEGVGGKLYLLADKLQFQSHHFNIQNHGQTIELNQIREVNLGKIYGLIPNGLTITTLDGKTEKFVVNDRRVWKEKIENEL